MYSGTQKCCHVNTLCCLKLEPLLASGSHAFGAAPMVTTCIAHTHCQIQCGVKMKEAPLSRAAHNGHLHMVQYLIQQGADVNCLDLVSRPELPPLWLLTLSYCLP